MGIRWPILTAIEQQKDAFIEADYKPLFWVLSFLVICLLFVTFVLCHQVEDLKKELNKLKEKK